MTTRRPVEGSSRRSNAPDGRIQVSAAATATPARSRMSGRLAASGLPSEIDRLEAGVAPIHHEDAEALLHPRLDVVRVRRKPARHLEFLARREHLLNRILPARLIEHALALLVGGREDAAQRAGAGPQ